MRFLKFLLRNVVVSFFVIGMIVTAGWQITHPHRAVPAPVSVKVNPYCDPHTGDCDIPDTSVDPQYYGY